MCVCVFVCVCVCVCVFERVCVCVCVSVKVKEGEKLENHLDLARELKKFLNMKLTVIPIVLGELETVPKKLEKTA